MIVIYSVNCGVNSY